MITKVEAIGNFLRAKTRPDLAVLYAPAMECQVNVAQDGGTRIDGEYQGRLWQAWTDGVQRWKSFRIPHNAATKPEFDLSSPMSYDLAVHAEGIGMTGWDWQNQLSRWVAFDFDAVTGHSDRHSRSLSNEELAHITTLVTDVDWVTVRKSTSGSGRHLYVFLDPPVHTANHTEHAALARAILGKLTALTGYSFESRVDTCGGNMWVWHRKMEGTDGLTIIKQGSPLAEPPLNWRDHIQVISGKRRKVAPTSQDETFNNLVNDRPRVPLDEQHKRLIKFLLEDNRTGSWWDSDHWLLITHTYQLQRGYEQLSLKGYFKTLADHDEQGTDHNCFCIPLRNGGWAVYRYSPGVEEHVSWSQDGSGYTRCYLNCEPDLHSAARAFGGIEQTTGGYRFNELSVAVNVAQLLGVRMDVPAPWAISRETILKSHKDGRLIVDFERRDLDQLTGWSPEKGRWRKIFDVRTAPTRPDEPEVGNYDDLIRHVITEDKKDFGWLIKTDNGWQLESRENVKSFLKSQGLSGKECDIVMGQAICRAWKLVNEPFKEEYPGDRKWNRDAAQLRFTPNPNIDSLAYPTWLLLLQHIGRGLDEAIKKDGWCLANSILTGADYLKAWIACLIQYPLEPLPYLFLYSPEQDTGKSSLHEAIKLLMTRGYARADAALINPQGFNGELKGSILCVVEETDLSPRRGRKDAYNRIKDWVTARDLPIHGKNETPYHIPNTTHWIQTSNDADACPIFPGDTRIIMIRVPPLDPVQLIPKSQFLLRLEREASDFLAAIMMMELPPPTGRMALPLITTEDKIETQISNRSPIDRFIEEFVYPTDGIMTEYKLLWQRFQETLDPSDLPQWTQHRFGREMAFKFPKGRNPSTGQWNFGNISLFAEQPSGPKIIVQDRNGNPYLVPERLVPDGQHQRTA